MRQLTPPQWCYQLSQASSDCDLFYSHAWDEGIYELARHVNSSWPAGCEGAYICCLSNPQNLDISEVLNHAEGSPFERILCSDERDPARHDARIEFECRQFGVVARGHHNLGQQAG